MDAETTIPFTTNPSRGVLVAGAAWFLTYLAARFALEAWAPPPTDRKFGSSGFGVGRYGRIV